MIKQRLITASILLFVVLTIIYKASPGLFDYFAGAVVLLVSYEWVGLSLPEPSAKAQTSYVLITLFFLCVTIWFDLSQIILYLAALMWVIALVSVLIYGSTQRWLFRNNIIYWICGWLFLTAMYHSLVLIRSSSLGSDWLVLSMASVWIMDSGAYLAGRAWGRHPLARKISPKKTWEGLWGGVILLVLYIAILYWMYAPVKQQPWLLAGLILAGLWSVMGDLFESACKRVAAVKDSGTLLPGHGGLLDRVDGLLAALPWLALWTLWYVG